MVESMLYTTHIYLGTLLYPMICDTWGVTLSKKRFLRGCIKPDVSTLFVRHPHFWRLSKGYLKKRIRKLSAAELREGRKNKKFSEGLGIALHYAADFFTSVHNITPNNLKEHLAFERELDKGFLDRVDLSAIYAALADVRRESARGTRLHEEGECAREIARRHKANKPEPKSVDYDIKEIVAACVLVTCGIMDAVRVRRGAVAARAGLDAVDPGEELAPMSGAIAG